jgi:nicotinate-nucleotide adenylyltransferase
VQLELDELRIIPTGQAWHKARALSPAEHRLQMVRLAFGDLPGVVIDERELQRQGNSYTIDTIEALQAELPGCHLYLLMGADQSAAFGSWHRWPDILERSTVCVADRPVEPTTPLDFAAPHDTGAPSVLDRAPGVVKLNLALMPLSATDIRQRLAGAACSAQELQSLVPEAVARYISLHRLYSPSLNHGPQANTA